MRVLVTSPAALGHIHPMVPLARALMRRGHAVLWAVPGNGVAAVARTGIEAVASGPSGLVDPGEAIRRYPELTGLPAEQVPDRMFGKLFGAILAPPMLDALMPVARGWRPDLLLADAGELAGPIVAAELGVPNVTKGFGPLLPATRVVAASEEVAPLWRSRGLEPRPFAGCYEHLYLDIYPPELGGGSAPHIARTHPLRPVSDDGAIDGADDLPLALPALPASAPLVYVTMGTVFNNPDTLRVIVGALAALENIRLLVTVGPRADPAEIGAVGSHVQIERYVTQSLVLPHADLVVSHGGSGTALAAAAHGLPQLCLPQGADQFLNAAAIAASGAGLTLGPGQQTPNHITAAARRLLHDAAVRSDARRVADGIAAMPSPDDVAVMLEQLA